MEKYFERYKEYYRQKNVKCEVINDKLWRIYAKMVIPIGPSDYSYNLTKIEAKKILNQFPNALLIRWQEELTNQTEGEWYSVICKKNYEIGDYSTKNRNIIRKGLKNFEYKIIAPEVIYNYGYEVYCSAFKNYQTKTPVIKEDEYKKEIKITAEFNDIIEYWGIFYNEKLIGYASNLLYDNIEVNYSTIKINPEYSKFSPSYAFFYSMNQYYLKSKKFQYVNDGFRSLSHESNIQDFLIEKFFFEKKYKKLKVVYKPALNFFLKISKPFGKMIKRFYPQVEPIYKLDNIKSKE